MHKSSASVLVATAAIVALSTQVEAHQTPYLPSMWNFDGRAGDPFAPIGPDLQTMDEWWFRGPATRAAPPADGQVTELPAGGSLTVEIACNIAWTSYGDRTTEVGSPLDGCPGNLGAYHASEPGESEINPDLVSGCALAIADKDNIDEVGWDDNVIFSVNHNCVTQKMTTFEIPAKMPACTGDSCICSWYWLGERGQFNWYQTPFRCKVTNVADDALALATPQDPVFCLDEPANCTKGAKLPLYASNSPSNTPWQGNENRPGYHASWSFGTDGAQNDIFVEPAAAPEADPEPETSEPASEETSVEETPTPAATATSAPGNSGSHRNDGDKSSSSSGSSSQTTGEARSSKGKSQSQSKGNKSASASNASITGALRKVLRPVDETLNRVRLTYRPPHSSRYARRGH